MKLEVRAYIFDLDGTLVDSSTVVPQAYIACIVSLGGPRYEPDEIIQSYAIGPPQEILSHLLRRSSTAEDLATYHRCLEAISRHLRPYEGIRQMLGELGNRHPLAVFSGASRRACDLLLSASGLEKFFAQVVGGDETDRPKPHPDGLLLTCRRLRVEPPEAAYVGDSDLDMKAAKAAGCHAIAAGWGHLFAPDHPVTDRVARVPSDLLAPSD